MFFSNFSEFFLDRSVFRFEIRTCFYRIFSFYYFCLQDCKMSKLASQDRKTGPSRGFLLHQHQQHHRKYHLKTANYTQPLRSWRLHIPVERSQLVWLLVSSGPGTEPQKLLTDTQNGSFTNRALTVFLRSSCASPQEIPLGFLGGIQTVTH